jgi:hypothetical protein
MITVQPRNRFSLKWRRASRNALGMYGSFGTTLPTKTNRQPAMAKNSRTAPSRSRPSGCATPAARTIENACRKIVRIPMPTKKEWIVAAYWLSDLVASELSCTGAVAWRRAVPHAPSARLPNRISSSADAPHSTRTLADFVTTPSAVMSTGIRPSLPSQSVAPAASAMLIASRMA